MPFGIGTSKKTTDGTTKEKPLTADALAPREMVGTVEGPVASIPKRLVLRFLKYNVVPSNTVLRLLLFLLLIVLGETF